MIKSKVTGFIDFGNGPIEVQGEATAEWPLPSEESVRAFNDEVRKMHGRIQTFQIPMSIVGTGNWSIAEHPAIPIPYEPTGPIVESTMAERVEEGR